MKVWIATAVCDEANTAPMVAAASTRDEATKQIIAKVETSSEPDAWTWYNPIEMEIA